MRNPRAWRTGLHRALLACSRPEPWKRGPVLTALALLLGLLPLLHAAIPDFAGLGSLVESVLPWLGVFIPVLLAAALWRRSLAAGAALLLPAVVWTTLFGGLLHDKSHPGGDLTVAAHNVGAANPDPAGTARALASSGADLLALEELTPRAAPLYEKALAKTYPHHAVRGTVGLWSKLPLSGTRTIDVMNYGPLAATKSAAAELPENRALRTTVTTPHGSLAVYVAHLGSVRPMPRHGFWTASRDIGAAALTKAVTTERTPRVLLLADLNGTLDDRAFTDLRAHLHSTQTTSGNGFGFTWPATFPMARIDQILYRGLNADRSWTLPETGSDHLPVAAALSWL
ncbi:endonuclease/exonuclease/phosphatase family protein [Streptomyces sp. NBC_01601]|uniref:endonuclease/exonuclease/phosphatase family protein n=1 Tax=Streptomyces sp. NBC_01601 TaxID=2975892 RepID=UPI002E283BB1|nr:endonuclease/exonuclease/phosphatase family protein [Streptomyces sp. NBC_01601]